MKYFKILIFFQLIFLLISCSTMKEGFKNQKKSSSDEFLVEKKSPLVMPPEYGELPIPKIDENEDNIESKDSSNKIEKLITNNDAKKDNSLEKNKNFENLIINQIKKN